jgi:hypothetical protein
MPDEKYNSSYATLSVTVRNFYFGKPKIIKFKLYNGQRNAKVLNLFIYLLQPYMFRAFF